MSTPALLWSALTIGIFVGIPIGMYVWSQKVWHDLYCMERQIQVLEHENRRLRMILEAVHIHVDPCDWDAVLKDAENDAASKHEHANNRKDCAGCGPVVR